MRAVTVLHGVDSSKHSGILANFNQTYVKEGILNKEASKIIKRAYMICEKSDYEDFYIVSGKETEEQLKNGVGVHFFVIFFEFVKCEQKIKYIYKLI
ncbi:MAG: hypothetical protein ACERKN_09090 [Velocimicrobium sp.]